MFEQNNKGEGQPRLGRSVVVRGQEATKRLKIGLDLAVDTVGATFGPRGKCVILQGEEGNSPVVTKDGVTVSKAVDPIDPVERMGAQLVREAASRTNEEAGDGTTTASVLTGALVSSVVKYSSSGFEPAEIKNGMDHAAKLVLDKLVSIAEKINTEESLCDIATISANGDKEIGQLVAQAVHKTGVDGVVTVENARSSTTSVEIVEGLRFERGYLSPYFVTDQEKMRAVYEDCAVLVTDRKISSLKDLVPLLESCARNRTPLLIIAEEVDGDAMQGLVINKATNGLPVVAVKLPGVGSDRDAQMNDLIALVGGTHPTVSSGNKVESVKLDQIGRVKKAVVDARVTTIVGLTNAQERVAQRVEELRSQLDNVNLSRDDVESIKRRLAKLSSGAAIIRVGGATELELVERKYRVEDALHAARAALEEGIVPGGGMALLRIKCELENDTDVINDISRGNGYASGMKSVLEACTAPLRRIVSNAGQSPDVVTAKCENMITTTPDHGWDVTLAKIINLRQSGIVDPAKVTRCAMQNAISVAGIFLQLDSVIHEPVKDQ